MKKRNLFSLKGWKLLTKFAVFVLFWVSFSFPMAVSNLKAESGKPGIVYDVVPSAQITQVSYYLKEFKGKETIFFEVGVKNISKEPRRYKLKVFIHEGPSGAYYYPRTGKPPVIKPGDAYMEPLAIVIYPQLPNGFTIKVEEFVY